MFRKFVYLSILLGITGFTLSACMSESTKSAIKTDTLSDALWELARSSEDANNYEKAASYYDRLYTRHPKNRNALLGYARNLRYLGLAKDAIKTLQSWEAKDTDLYIKIEIGKAQLAASLINDAKITLTQVVEKDPKLWEAHSALGIIYDRLKDFKSAHESYQTALKLSPDNTNIKNNFALSLSQDGKINRAITMLEKIIEDNQAGPQTRQNLALLFGLNGEFKKAHALALTDLPKDLAARNLLILKELHAIKNIKSK
ncbi:MAG: hypothetical protein CMP14_00150 [Rickettsiales bacterium]|nr:hypothetical protein [Rickettsiales bacterium]